jgi:hypothetical protein
VPVEEVEKVIGGLFKLDQSMIGKLKEILYN